MAEHLLAEGRVGDVVHMMEPLVRPSLDEKDQDVSNATGVLRLHALWAQIACVARLQPDEARRHLPSTEADLSAHPPRVQAEAALWHGWIDVLRGDTKDALARGLAQLSHADQHFETLAHRPGRRWVHLGQAQAYFALDEYDLMRHALDEAQALGRLHTDRLAQCWLHDMYAPALRFQGQYARAKAHTDALKSTAHQLGLSQWVGHAQAQEAALAYDTGASPEVVIERATTAEMRLQGAADCRPYPLLAAYHAHVGALLRSARWDEADACIADALSAMRGYALGEAHLHSLCVRLALCRGDAKDARAQLDEVTERADRLPHGLHRSHLALLHAEVARQTGDVDAARTWEARAHQNARETGHQGNQVRALLAQAQSAAEAGHCSRAQSLLREAEAFASYRSVLPMAARWSASEAALATAQAQQSEDTQAVRYAAEQYAQAHTAYRLSGNVLRAAQMALRAATALPRTDRLPALRPMLSNAAATMQRCGRREQAERLQTILDDWPAHDPADTTAWGSLLGMALAEAPPEHTSITAACTALLQAHPQVEGTRIQYRPRHAQAQCLVADEGSIGAASDTTQLHYPTPTDARLTLTYAADAPLPGVDEVLRLYLPILLMALDRAPAPEEASAVSTASCFPEAFVAESAPMQALEQRIRQIGASHSPVLVTGAPGVGKTMVARAVHAVSERRTGPLHVVERTSVQPRDWAAHLFGHVENDAYTPGVLDDAAGGSVLLKAVHRLPQNVHDQLLRMLNTGCVFPVGSDTCRSVDVRLLATLPSDSARSPAEVMPAALAHRLGIITLRVPPLRERRADIPVLVQRVLDEQRSPQTPLATITQHALDALLAYDWPGNVRQLRNEVERAYQLVRSEPAPQITTDALAAPIREARTQHSTASHPYDTLLNDDTVALNKVLAETEKAAIEHVLRAHDGHVSASAEDLGISRQGLYKKMKRLDIDADAAVSSS